MSSTEEQIKKLKKEVNRLRSVNIELTEKWTRSQRAVKELQREVEELKSKKDKSRRDMREKSPWRSAGNKTSDDWKHDLDEERKRKNAIEEEARIREEHWMMIRKLFEERLDEERERRTANEEEARIQEEHWMMTRKLFEERLGVVESEREAMRITLKDRTQAIEMYQDAMANLSVKCSVAESELERAIGASTSLEQVF
ncbi:hypothetical protein PQX77_008650 [Marasmius sp. AFHP31]|nr:hypothetical protein PQX77_008650 [Marasmius sp. AFHP31]